MCDVFKASFHKLECQSHDDTETKRLLDAEVRRYLSFPQFGPIRFDVVHDAAVGSRKCDSSDQQDDEDHVGEGRREVHNLKHTHAEM